MAIVEHYVRITVSDSSGLIASRELPVQRWGIVNGAPVDQEYTISASTFQAFTVPSGAKAVNIIHNGAPSLVLKGVTGDGTGIVLTGASNNIADDVFLPFAGSALGILNNGANAASIRVIWYV